MSETFTTSPHRFYPYAAEDASPQTGPVRPGPKRKKKAPAKPQSQWKQQIRGLPDEALQSGLFAANAPPPRCRPQAAAPDPARPMQEDPPAQRAEQPTPAQDTEPDTEAPPKRNHHAGHGLPENLPNLPFPFVKATCRFGATEPTASGRSQRPLEDIVAFGTVKDLADAVDGGKTDVRYGNKYSVAQKLRAAAAARAAAAHFPLRSLTRPCSSTRFRGMDQPSGRGPMMSWMSLFPGSSRSSVLSLSPVH